MPSWLLKAATQRLIGLLPNPHYWNGLIQTRIARSIKLPSDQFLEKLSACQAHLAHLRRFRREMPEEFAAVELGTGWFPVVPIGLFLCGASKIWTWDVAAHLQIEHVRFVLNSFLRLDAAGELERRLPGLVRERIDEMRKIGAAAPTMDLTKLLEQLNIRYRIGDATCTGLPPRSIDLITSLGVLEYLSAEALPAMLRELRRISVTDAVMSHWIAVDDQYAHYDRTITPYNFLKFSDRTWRWINNPIIPLNRLRVSDYRRALGDAGFRITEETVTLRGDPADLATIPLAPRFRAYQREDLLVLRAWLAATPA